MRKHNAGGVAAEVAAVIGMALIAVIAAGLLVAKGVQWLTDYRQKPKPMIISFNDNGDGGDSGGVSPDLADPENDNGEGEEQSVAEPRIQADTGHFTDSRDGKKYRSVKIGGKTWMAENLNYKTSTGSCCYTNEASNCDKYGRLYDWNTAMKACPPGWRLPTSQDWDNLGAAAGGEKRRGANGISHWPDAGDKLKAKRGWNEELKGIFLVKNDGSLEETLGKSGNGTDDYGFSALPGKSRLSAGQFINDFAGHWWTATEAGDGLANRVYIENDGGGLFEKATYSANFYSVRCAAD